jgi:hypothetical protein
MPQFIVVEVDDDRVADALVEKLSNTGRPLVGKQWRVVGRFQRPRAHCQHALTTGGYNDAKHFARGSKYGWWIHNIAGCKRPRLGSHQLENLIGVENYPLDLGSKYTERVATLHVFEVPTANMARGDVDPA